MSAQPDVTLEEQPRKISVAEYFEMRRRSDVRLEYVDGEIVAMAGGSLSHDRIARNLIALLEAGFDSNQCESFAENMGIRTSADHYRYPDVAALCSETEQSLPFFLQSQHFLREY